jgi:hypothetical protein
LLRASAAFFFSSDRKEAAAGDRKETRRGNREVSRGLEVEKDRERGEPLKKRKKSRPASHNWSSSFPTKSPRDTLSRRLSSSFPLVRERFDTPDRESDRERAPRSSLKNAEADACSRRDRACCRLVDVDVGGDGVAQQGAKLEGESRDAGAL